MYKTGGEALLSPGSVSSPITSVVWTHGRDIAVERYGDNITVYRDFKGRCEVDINTGALRISKLRLKDSGIYTAEINRRIMKATEVTVITPVPKPTISSRCRPKKTQCTLTCEASITDDMGPLIYSWYEGGRRIPEYPHKQLNISKDDPELVGNKFSCYLENQVSSERSDDIISPFRTEISGGVNVAAVTVLMVPIVLILVLAAIVCWFKPRQKKAKKMTRKIPENQYSDGAGKTARAGPAACF